MAITGLIVPLHRSLTTPILMAGAPRTAAISIGTLAAALGLGLQLWIVGMAVWGIGHAAAVYAARRDPAFVEVTIRHIRHKGYLAC